MIRGALVEGEGEVWVAEAYQGDMRGEKEIVGVTVWFLPGHRFLGSERQRNAVRWDEFMRMVGPEQERWYNDYVSRSLEVLRPVC
ncbi:hypothetical protein CALCODRAFT_499057 [Calocera cornea HHB12733]|uniref:Uncharacterized protein n=1 Tax=Calocera cornea HHB12733 TaxID=1353952 RepID=A0A165ELL1_9BASI|nr:hypothetical protein CALCODRAFT_499057 [Calocera cornea HHB12733]